MQLNQKWDGIDSKRGKTMCWHASCMLPSARATRTAAEGLDQRALRHVNTHPKP